MNHLKVFENLNYKKDDYVIIDMKSDFSVDSCLAKIIKSDVVKPNYFIKDFEINDTYWIYDDSIRRLATEDEINEYEAIKNSNKFNI